MRRSRPLLGTFVTITAWGVASDRLQTAIGAAFREFEFADAVLSNHREDSELSRLNRFALPEPMVLSPELFSVLQTARNISELTRGSFDVTLQPLTQLWGFISKEHRFPAPQELERALPRVGYSNLLLDPTRHTARKLRPDLAIDLGGIGKGWAVDRAIDRLQKEGVPNAMVKAGGDLRVMGQAPGGGDWTVQLEDPRKEGRRVEVRLREGALSTSGHYENFFIHEGRRYSHILDPRTGLPVQGIASCTVVAPTCVESDAWATACFVQGVEESLREFGQRFAIRFVLVPAAAASAEWPVRSTRSFPYSRTR